MACLKNHWLSEPSVLPSLLFTYDCKTSLAFLTSLPLRANATIMPWLNLAARAVSVSVIWHF